MMNNTIHVIKRWDGFDLNNHPASELMTELTPNELLNTHGGIGPVGIALLAGGGVALGVAAGYYLAKMLLD